MSSTLLTTHLRRWLRPAPITSAAAVLMTSALIAGCGGSSQASAGDSSSGATGSGPFTGGSPGAHPQPGGNLRFSWSLAATDLDPTSVNANGNLYADWELNAGLVQYVGNKIDPVPALASSWRLGTDDVTYNFQLRSGIKFSDGTPITTADVVFSLKRFDSPVNGFATPPVNFRSVTATGPSSVRVVLQKPFPAFIEYLGTTEASILPKAYFHRVGAAQFGLHPIGAGPFKVASFTPNSTLKMVRNPYYWRQGLPYLDSVTLTPTPDANLRILGVRSGQADVADQVPFSQIKSLMGVSGVRMLVEHLAGISLVWMNADYKPLSSELVRRALSYATPRNVIIQDVFHGYATVATSYFAPGGHGWSASIHQLPYDIGAAKSALAQTQWKKGFPVQVEIVGGDPDTVLEASILQNSWAKIGVRVSIRQVDSGTLYSDDGSKNQVSIPPTNSYTSDIPSPEELSGFADIHLGDAYGSHVNNPQTTDWLEQAVTARSQALHNQLFQKIQAAGIDNPPTLAIAYPPAATLVRSDVCNWHTQSGGYWLLDSVYLGKC